MRLSILINFGTSMQNAMPMTTNKSKSKQEVKFQYGGRPYSQIRNKNNSAVAWAISAKFHAQRYVYFHFTDASWNFLADFFDIGR